MSADRYYEDFTRDTIVGIVVRAFVPAAAPGEGFVDGLNVIESSSLGCCRPGERVRVPDGRVGFVSKLDTAVSVGFSVP